MVMIVIMRMHSFFLKENVMINDMFHALSVHVLCGLSRSFIACEVCHVPSLCSQDSRARVIGRKVSDHYYLVH